MILKECNDEKFNFFDKYTIFYNKLVDDKD